MGSNFAGGLLAGVTGAVFWISFCLAFGWENNLKLVGMLAVVFLVGVTAVSTVIANVTSKKKLAQST